MLALISPAKKMNFDKASDAPKSTRPALLNHTTELAEVTKKLSRAKLASMMKISQQLANLNYTRFQSFVPDNTSKDLKQAALAFAGDVYVGLEASDWSKDDFVFAQDHLRILSGMYGLLRPLDGIQPYRLEMGRKLKTSRGEDLYDFWGEDIANSINKAVQKSKHKAIINLASNEYFKAARKDLLDAPIITPVFHEEKDGQSRILALFAKRARGLMARYIVKNKLTNLNDLKKFNLGGYKFRKSLSTDEKWIFARPQPAPVKPLKKTSKNLELNA